MSTHISTAMPAPAWDSITKSEDYQSMTPADQAEIKSKYFHNFIAPKISAKIASDPELKAGGMDAAYQEWMRRSDDSGQGYITSGLSSVARGATSVIPNTVSGLGYVLDSESLIGAGEGIQQGLNAALPVNPVLENTFGMKALNAVGQAIGVMATGMTGGAITGTTAGASRAVLAQAALSGAAEGGQTADQYGMTGLSRAAMIAAGAGGEVLTEKLPFGTAVETGVAQQLFRLPMNEVQQQALKAAVKPVTGIVSEGFEEGTNQIGQNAAVNLLAPSGAQTPGLLQGAGEASLLGMVGGTTFAGANYLAGRMADGDQPPATLPPTETPPTGTTEPAAKLQYDTRGNLLNPLTPQQAAPINVQFNGMTFHRDATGAWGQVNETPAPGTLPVTLLDPLNGTEGHLITQLDDIADRTLRLKKPAAETPQQEEPKPRPPVEVSPASVQIPPDQLASAQEKAREGGLQWAQSVDLSQPVGVMHTPSGMVAFSDAAKVLAAQMTGRPLLVQPTVLTAEDTPPATTNSQLGAPAAPTVTHMKPAAAGEVQHASQLAEQFKPGNMVAMKSGEGDAVVQSVNPDHTVTVNREDGTTDTVQPDAISMLPPESKSPSQGGIYTAVQIGGKVITTPGVHYDAVLNHAIREDLTPMEKDGLDAQQIKELADRKLVEKGPQWLRDHVVEGFVIGGQFYNRVQAKQKLNDMGIETPLAEQEQRDWLDSADIQNPADLMSPAEYDAMQEKNEALLESIGLPSKPGTQLWATQLIKNALARMAHDAELPATTRLVAEALAKLNMPQILFSVTADARGTFAGLYTPRSWDGTRGGVGEISINTRVKGRGEGDARYTLIHEVLHHATTWLRHNPKTAFDKQQVENLERLRKRAQAYAASLGDVETKNHPARKFDYEFSNVDEFITGLFTRADFQQFLASIPSEYTPSLVGRVRSVLQEMFRTIAKLVTGGEVEKGSLLDESFGAALNLMHGEDVARGNLPPVLMNPVVTPDMDAEYMQAVRDGDVKKQQAMVYQVGYENGYTHRVFHGTHRKFTEFNRRSNTDSHKIFELNEWGIWTTEDKAASNLYGPTRMDLLGKMNNPKRFQTFSEWFDDYVDKAYPLFSSKGANDVKTLREDLKKWAGKNKLPGTKAYNKMLSEFPGADGYRERLLSEGHDGVLIEGDFIDGELQTVRVFLDSSQLKSADPVTRDDGGNVIPLSQRFNNALPDIRMSPADDYRFSRLEREQEFVPRNADGSLQKLKDTFKYVNSVEQNRTIEGKPIEQVLAYVPRRDELMEPAVMEVLDDLVRANASSTDILKLITSGTQPGSNVHIEADERAIFTRWMLNSGRWRDFDGLTEDKVIAAFESLASQFGYLGQQWQAILDPMTKLKDEATAKTGEAFKAETGEDIKGAWAELQKQIDALKGTIKQLLGKGVQGVEGSDVVEAEQAIDESFRGKLARDGAQRIADAFFFSRDTNDTDVGPLVEGADMVKGELTKLLNESLDRMGITKVQPDKPKQDEFQRIAVALGLDDVRSDKLKEIDRRVRERVAEMLEAEEIDAPLAEMLISQWETSSSAMLNTSVSGSTARRVFKQVMKDNDVSMSDLLGLSAKERTRAIREISHEVASRVAKAGSTKDLTNLRKVVEAAGHQIVSSAEQQREKLKALMKDNQDVAEDIIAAFEKKFAGIPSFAPQKKGIRKLVDDAIRAREIMPDFVERAMALGVDELTAKTLGDMTLEHGRRKAAEREERERKQAAERRKAKIETTIKRLLGTNKKSTERTSRFIGNLLRADELGILDSKVFADAFATAFNLNNLTPAVVRKLRDNWREITRLGPDGLPVWRGIPRETLERRFIAAVNAVSPGARLGNVIFDQYQAAALATVGSIINQFSGLFRGLFGVDAFSRSFSRGDVLGTAQEWWKNMSDMFGNLPLMLTGVQGESLGHGRSELKSTFTPGEQKLALTGDGQQFRILHKDGSVTMMPENWRKVLRLKELWTWRTIRAAEAVSGVTDSQAWFRQVLALHYQKQGMSAAEARRRSFEDTAGTEEERASATEQAQRERDAGLLAANDKAQFNRRVQEIINERIETKLGTSLISRVEYLTAASQFKTVPTGVLGYPIYRMFNMLSKSQNPIGKAAKFFFLFGRFLGHTVDTMMAYTPGLSIATLARDSSDSARTKLIREIYGDTATYNQQQHGKHAAGAAFLLVNGMLMALAQAMADDDEEPFYQIFGSAPGASRDQKEALQAAGKWKEGVVRLFGMDISYNQIPELAPLFSLLGNASDYTRFGQQLYSEKGKQLPMGEAAVMSIQDVLLSPVKRSTYKQWVDAVGKAMSGEKSDAFANIVTQPVGTALRLPIVADLDKLFRQMEGSQDAKGYGQNLLRRIPFVAVGDHMFNGYGEQLPSLGVISMFPPDAQVPEEVKKAASLNVETGTVRALPKDPQLKDDRELTSDEREQFVKRSGHYFVESLLRNQESVRRAYKTGGREAAQKVVSNISSKANERAKKELGLLKK